MKYILNNVGLIAIAIAITAGVFVYQNMRKQELKNQAVDGCANVESNIAENDFVRFIYFQCMKDKGYETDLTQ
jgi:hypothetical protein